MGKKKERKLTPFKQFLIISITISAIGIIANAILYYFNLPNNIQNIIENKIATNVIIGVSFVVFNILLYFIVKINHIIKH